MNRIIFLHPALFHLVSSPSNSFLDHTFAQHILGNCESLAPHLGCEWIKQNYSMQTWRAEANNIAFDPIQERSSDLWLSVAAVYGVREINICLGLAYKVSHTHTKIRTYTANPTVDNLELHSKRQTT